MKFSAQLVTLAIASFIKTQNTDILNFVNSQISIVDAGLPTGRVQSDISFVDGQISQAWAAGISTIVIGIDNNRDNAFSGRSDTKPTPTNIPDSSFATPTDGSSNNRDSFGNTNSDSTAYSSISTSTNTLSTSSGGQLALPAKHTYLVSAIVLSLIGNYLL